MYEFVSVTAGHNPFEYRDFKPDIKKLAAKYAGVLVDDYNSGDFADLLNEVAPHLYAGAYNGEFIGFVYLNDWRGSKEKFHSATLTVCIDKKFWGKTAREAGRLFIKKVFKHYKCFKLKALVFEHNLNANNFLLSLGFKKESLLLNETFKNNKPVNIIVYGIYRDCFPF